MGLTFIKRDRTPRGRTRTNMDKELQDAWGTSSFRNEGDKDKAAFLERKIRKEHGFEKSRVTAKLITDVKTKGE